MTESGTASSKPNPKMSGVVRAAMAVARGEIGSLSMPRAVCSAGVTRFWKTGPPSAASSSQGRPVPPGWKAVACRSTSSPVPPATGVS